MRTDRNGYYLLIHFSPEGNVDPVGQFYLGPDPVFAKHLFRELQGNEELTNYSILFMELVEYKQGLPFNLIIKNCTLPELGENVKIITKELFKRTTLREGE